MIEHREALVYMLCEAAELEHGIMCWAHTAGCLRGDDAPADTARICIECGANE